MVNKALGRTIMRFFSRCAVIGVRLLSRAARDLEKCAKVSSAKGSDPFAAINSKFVITFEFRGRTGRRDLHIRLKRSIIMSKVIFASRMRHISPPLSCLLEKSFSFFSLALLRSHLRTAPGPTCLLFVLPRRNESLINFNTFSSLRPFSLAGRRRRLYI